MRSFLLIANATVALIFAGFFAYTFLGRQHIDRMAREFVTHKTEKFARPAVDTAEEILRSDSTRRLLTADQLATVEAEIAEFRSQPTKYIQRLTSADAPPKPKALLGRLTAKVHGWKEGIRAHYNKVLRRLITDLRIFSGSNGVAACIAFFCAWRSPSSPSLPLTAVSVVLLIATALSAFMYYNDFSFFTILSDSYLGWWYPAVIGSLFMKIWVEYAAQRQGKVECSRPSMRSAE